MSLAPLALVGGAAAWSIAQMTAQDRAEDDGRPTHHSDLAATRPGVMHNQHNFPRARGMPRTRNPRVKYNRNHRQQNWNDINKVNYQRTTLLRDPDFTERYVHFVRQARFQRAKVSQLDRLSGGGHYRNFAPRTRSYWHSQLGVTDSPSDQ